MLRIVPLLVFVISFQAPLRCDARLINNANGRETYAILIDGGSTGSKMFIYKISLNNKAKVEEVSDLEEKSNSLGKVKPGLSSLLHNLDDIPLYMEKFIKEAKKIVPEDKWDSTPILVLATAGMRLLQEADQDLIMYKVGL